MDREGKRQFPSIKITQIEEKTVLYDTASPSRTIDDSSLTCGTNCGKQRCGQDDLRPPPGVTVGIHVAFLGHCTSSGTERKHVSMSDNSFTCLSAREICFFWGGGGGGAKGPNIRAAHWFDSVTKKIRIIIQSPREDCTKGFKWNCDIFWLCFVLWMHHCTFFFF